MKTDFEYCGTVVNNPVCGTTPSLIMGETRNIVFTNVFDSIYLPISIQTNRQVIENIWDCIIQDFE